MIPAFLPQHRNFRVPPTQPNLVHTPDGGFEAGGRVPAIKAERLLMGWTGCFPKRLAFELVKVDCAACNHVALLTPEAQLTAGPIPRQRFST